MSKSLTEAAKDILGGNVSAKAASQDAPKKIGGDVPEVLTPNKEPKGDSKPTVNTKETSPPGPTPPGGKEAGKKLSPTVAQGTEPSNTAASAGSKKLKDGVNKEEDNNDAIYEEEEVAIEIGDLVEDADGNVGEVVGIDEETGELEVSWQSLQEAEDKDDEDEEDDSEDDDEEEDKKEDVKESAFDKLTFNLSDDVTAMFNGEELSEEFKSKVTTIFEAAVKSRVQEYAAELDKVYEEQLAEAVEKTAEAISESVETYLEHAVEEWKSENEVAIQTNLRTELTEDFITGLRNLFIENYIDVPDEKMDILEELSLKVENLESELNEKVEETIALKKTLKEQKRDEILRKLTEGLVETQRDKIYSLAENVEFKDEEAFEEAVSTLRENYFPLTEKAKKGTDELDDLSEQIEDGKVVNQGVAPPLDEMDRYVKAIGRTSL